MRMIRNFLFRFSWKRSLFCIKFLACVLTTFPVQAYFFDNIYCGHQVFVQPDLYYLKRTRAGGSHQSGLMHGVKFGYKRIICNGFYWEANASYGDGKIKGKNGNGVSLHSKFSDENVEGRFGYTFEFTRFLDFSFTPYGGYGYFKQTNRFVDPSPLTIEFRDSFHFASLGFLSELFTIYRFSVGLDFEAKFMIDGKSKVVDDPDPTIEDMYLIIGNKTQYDVEIPITYIWCCEERQWHLGLIPFYQLRQYGGHENYPYDFLRTKYEIYGARLSLDWQF